ncbi:putative UPF0481 protein [Zea mays]|jgi:hypothetical protein|uniref:Putative UPF0481 protein n=2 Tax=Zea mays TaxID=4577 RepID=B6SVC9_MAIZE|nr:Putative UPF0481 protein At3g02645-like [Zea mays]ACG28812.1 hypothetical protein [Zea mays]AQK69516.1 Putative UPF0481 protein [Zea mays]PWZ20224.1 putative UPF0481 protein [Zea mays]|eukprot:NP_001143080.1 uncharacterized protein LOC100275553 [Zea mays]
MLSEPPPQQPRARSFAAADVEEQSEDEKRWVGWVEKSLRHETAEALGAAAKVFSVPRSLRDTNPDAYAPHVFSLGPYHQARPELMDMQRFKLAGAKRFEMLLTGGHTIEHIKDRFLVGGLELKIRAIYHRFLDLNDTTLVWMMAIDACFLLDFIENYHRREATDVVSSSANWINAVVRDAMMLENQIPLFVFARTLELRHSTRHEAAKALHAVVLRFIMDVCPFKDKRGEVAIGDLAKHAHLLEVLYHFLVPDATLLDDSTTGGGGDQGVMVEEEIPATAAADGEEVDDDVEAQQAMKPPLEEEDCEKVKQALSQASRLNVAPLRFIKKNLIARPMALVGKIAHKVPALAALVPVLSKLMQSVNVEAQLNGGAEQAPEDGAITAPRADEIRIPSVEELARCGVRFTPAPEGIEGIAFDRASATLRLPVITLDANTEVVLRNLVAYEAVAVRGPLVLARYTELMNGIIDTSKDVKILRRSGVLVNHMKSNKEAAGMWNGMARATRLTKVPRLDAVISAVNAHRSRSAAARVRKLFRKYVFRSWKMLTLLASIGLLLMTALQTFCSAYPCENHWFSGMVLPGTTDDPAQ